MTNPLQAQLLKAGLANKKQLKKANHEQRLKRQRQKNNPLPPTANNEAQQKKTAQAKRNKQLNLQRARQREEKEKKAQIKQLIKDNSLPLPDKGEPYHFVDNTTIKRLLTSPEMIEQLSKGILAIVRDGANYAVVPAKVARQLAKRDNKSIITLHS